MCQRKGPVFLALGAAAVVASVLGVTAAARPAYADQAPAAKVPVAKLPAATPVVPTGSITGTVLFEGEAPDRPALKRDGDPYCQRTPRLSEAVIVTKGKLKDVLVRIKNGTVPMASDQKLIPAVIEQKECMYSPRVLGIQDGQQITMRNSDGTFHNVRGTVAGKPLWNEAQPAKAKDLTLNTPTRAGDVIDVQCDVHPWMHAYAVVQDTPFFAVTGEDGAFTITGLPPGTYTLEAWHPTLGTKSLTVKLGTGKKGAITARFSYKAGE